MSLLKWKYDDARGISQTGTMEHYYIYLGGTDHVAYMRRLTGELDLVSGSRLKAMVSFPHSDIKETT